MRDVEVEDVANTSLSQKGDGFKSLFAMSVLQYMARQRHGSNLIFGIEEPEAHLHSSATYEIKNTLRTLSDSFQIVITTHSPILIQRDDIRSNIIVEQVQGNDFASEAKPARSLSDIRRSLGIRPQDNMMTAEVVLVVEGATEEQCLPALLSKILPDLSDHLTMGRVRVISAGGASKVVSVIRALARDAASCVVLFDSDEEGNRAFGHLTSSGLIGVGDVFQVPNRSGCLETEFEDVFPPELYIVQIGQACGISTSVDEFTTYRTRSGNHQTRMDKWSNVMQSITAAHGKMWNTCEDSAKSSFGLAVTQNIDAIEPDDYPWIRSIGTRIQMYLGQA